MINTITGKIDFLESLRGKKATYILAMSDTKTSQIEGITQAGIPGKIYLTPILDSEFLCTGEVRSLKDIAKTSKGVPTPALITRAVHLLNPFSNIELLNLGIEVIPQVDYFKIHNMQLKPSSRIDEGADIDAMDVFQKGLVFGQAYELKDDYLILAESVPAGTTTATASALALGYKCKDLFSSSFKAVPDSIRNKTIEKALSNIKKEDDLFGVLSKVSDNMLIFYAGVILGLNNSIKVILAGGTQMACVLLIVNAILKTMQGEFNTSNLALCTTKWVYEDEYSDIKALLEMLDFKVNSYYSDFDFSLSSHPALKLYDNGEAKEGVGAGAALVYAFLNGKSKEQLTKKIESFFRVIMKILYFGGQKSGKSSLAEKKALELAKSKPYYIATYNNSYDDKEMHKRVDRHKANREDSFITLEETKDLIKVIQKGNTYIVDCISMWIFNNLDESQETLIKQLEHIETLDCNIVFVLNEVTSGVIPFDKDSRRFVDLTGIIGQKLVKLCDEVYEAKFGLESRLK